MNECNQLGANIVEWDVIGRIVALGLIAGAAILIGCWLIERVSKQQAEENNEHIRVQREIIKELRELKLGINRQTG